jgi:hypothetical protein
MLPLGGDEVLNAVSLVKARKAEKTVRAELMQQILMSARAAGWVARMAELAEAKSRDDAARRLAEVLMEATGASGAVVYLANPERAEDLVRAAATPMLEGAPMAGAEADVLAFARSEGLVDVQLALRTSVTGHVLLLNAEDAGSGSKAAAPSSVDPVPSSAVRRSALRDGLLKLLTTQASAALTLLNERERIRGLAGIKDATTSAYSLGYYADVAAREVYRAGRFGRRLAVAAVIVDPRRAGEGAAGLRPASAAWVAEHALKVMPDLTILGRVEENELHMLMPETDGLGAHACRRRVLTHLDAVASATGVDMRGVLVGAAAFPHEGQELIELTRAARARAEASAISAVHLLSPDQRGLRDLLGALEGAAAEGVRSGHMFAPRALELPIDEAASLAAVAVAAAMRGGPVLVIVTYRPDPNLFRTVRAAMGGGGPGITLRVLDVRAAPGGEDLDAVCVFAEHGAYTFMGRVRGGSLRGAHAADALFTDLLAVHLGRAAGVRLFG